MWLRLRLRLNPANGTSHIPGTLSEIHSIPLEKESKKENLKRKGGDKL